MGSCFAARIGQSSNCMCARIILLAILAIGAVGICIEVGIRSAPLPGELFTPGPATPAVDDLHGRTISIPASDFARDARPARLREFGRWLPEATVRIEDHRFFSHPGLDVIATTGAALRNLLHHRIISGASTISQQTVKLGGGRVRRTLDAKWHEAFSALRLEREWTKEQILEWYMNRLDYGNRRIGPVAAAHAYFGKAPAELTFAEAVYLAGIPQSPTRLNPWKNPSATLARYRRNVQRMESAGQLPAGVTAAGLLRSPPVPGRFDPHSGAPHFSREALARNGGGAGRRRSTLDLTLQAGAEAAAAAARNELAQVGAGACAIVILDNATGGVRAMVSSSLPQYGEVNLTMTPRSAGSTLKPFLYLEALDRRIVTAASLLPDTEEAVREGYADYDPRNYNDRFAGPVRLREALGNSLNVPAVVVLSRIGARDAFARMQSWGLRFRQEFDASGAGFILGNADVTLLELTGAYAALARGASAWQPVFLVGEPVQPERCGSRDAAAIITDILCDPQARRMAFGNSSLLDAGARVAVKTGTSSGFRDGWCIGFTAGHTVGVWTGNPDGSPMDSALAVRSAAPVWNAVVRHLLAHGDLPVPPIEASESLSPVLVAAETGLLPRPGEPTVLEWFLAGSAPAESAASMYRPLGGKQILQLPGSYAGWCASSQNRIGATASNQRLEILFPCEGAVFTRTPSLPPSQQVLRPQSNNPDCEWLANGEKIPVGGLPLSPGTFTLTAKSGTQQQTRSFRVEEPE